MRTKGLRIIVRDFNPVYASWSYRARKMLYINHVRVGRDFSISRRVAFRVSLCIRNLIHRDPFSGYQSYWDTRLSNCNRIIRIFFTEFPIAHAKFCGRSGSPLTEFSNNSNFSSSRSLVQKENLRFKRFLCIYIDYVIYRAKSRIWFCRPFSSRSPWSSLCWGKARTRWKRVARTLRDRLEGNLRGGGGGCLKRVGELSPPATNYRCS